MRSNYRSSLLNCASRWHALTEHRVLKADPARVAVAFTGPSRRTARVPGRIERAVWATLNALPPWRFKLELCARRTLAPDRVRTRVHKRDGNGSRWVTAFCSGYDRLCFANYRTLPRKSAAEYHCLRLPISATAAVRTAPPHRLHRTGARSPRGALTPVPAATPRAC